jgi:hypothetical protein
MLPLRGTSASSLVFGPFFGRAALNEIAVLSVILAGAALAGAAFFAAGVFDLDISITPDWLVLHRL